MRLSRHYIIKLSSFRGNTEVHPLAQGKSGPNEPTDQAADGLRGSLTTKIHLLCDAHVTPLPFLP